MAAQGEPGYQAAQSDPGSNSERSTDSPMPGSEDDLVAGAPLHSPEWSEERFRVDRKKLEAMLQGRHPRVLRLPVGARTPSRTSLSRAQLPTPATVDLVPRSPPPRNCRTPKE
ncbi:protein bicaudal c homolog 1 [Lynx pardinus]|uniref:Protein bicaudal c homolog 1 n=1 Tax=Lynx pardinus TaxID=191816 RepID=A0A485PMA7_LYNPA|nr:protein bicaudal c homolog 1 [Lynx pardinus]